MDVFLGTPVESFLQTCVFKGNVSEALTNPVASCFLSKERELTGSRTKNIHIKNLQGAGWTSHRADNLVLQGHCLWSKTETQPSPEREAKGADVFPLKYQ